MGVIRTALLGCFLAEGQEDTVLQKWREEWHRQDKLGGHLKGRYYHVRAWGPSLSQAVHVFGPGPTWTELARHEGAEHTFQYETLGEARLTFKMLFAFDKLSFAMLRLRWGAI